MSEFCHELHQLFNGLERFRFPYDPDRIPRDGVYVLFERGERAHDTDRIVRIGAHDGEHRLAKRLLEHFVTENKDRSIFRKNIGRAILNRDGDPFLKYWEVDLTPKKNRRQYQGLIDREKQKDTERRVTAYIQDNLSFVVVRVTDRARRKTLESRLIATVSLCGACGPSREWLGLHSPKPKIRESGLWQEQHLYKTLLSMWDMEVLRRLLSPGP